MSTFFQVLGDILGLLNDFKIFGNISVLHILMTGMVVLIIAKFVKGKK